MKAVVFHQHGPLDNIRYEDYPEPELGRADCLVAVKAVSLNGFDPMVLSGIPGLRTPLPMIPGADIAGEVVGIAGLIGSGRTEIAKIIFGALKRNLINGGTIKLRGRPIRYRVPKEAINDGITYITEDRKLNGFF